MKFLSKAKKHQYYLYISAFLIALFFVGNYLISNKITSVTKELNEFVIQGNIRAKHKTLRFDFSNLNNFILNADEIIETSKTLNKKTLEKNLLLICKLATAKENIDNSFVFFIENNKITNPSFLHKNNSNYIKNVTKQALSSSKKQQKTIIDDVVNFKGNVYNRKMIVNKLTNNTTVVVGYDINLLKYWKYHSENYSGDGAYSILTNSNGICMLHPDSTYIGTNISHFFKRVTKEKILNNKVNNNNFKVNELIKTKTTSEFLNLNILRYFSPIQLEKSSMILITNFPITLSSKGTINNVKQYFLWISALALCTFLLLLGISRLQLRKEFSQKLKYEEEKNELAISNEKYQQENTVLQLNQLKKKMNPHFLFNTLNSLIVLIDLNTDLSQKFVLKLAEVYRYLLENREDNLINVKEELHFLEQYFFLQKIRFKDSLHLKTIYDCTDKKKSLSKKIPFLALETLVENAIKHNEATKQKPLFIEILIKDEQIMVSNNYNPRKTKEQKSHHIGLKYLKNSYNFYKTTSFKTEITNTHFKCYLPLLS